MVQLQKDLEDIQATGTQVIAISYDSVETLAAFAEKREITFPLLSDEGSKVIDAFGIRNEGVAAGSRQDGIPHPGTFIVDGQGRIRVKLFRDRYSQRHTNEELIGAAKKID